MQLYEKIYYDIYNKIVSGEYKEGDLCPSEKELAEQYQVSKAPIRQAMNKLETIGMIERKRGKGTYVRRLEPSNYKMQLCGLTANFYEAVPGMKYTTQTLDITPTPQEIAARVADELPPRCIHIERTGYLNGKPQQISRHYLFDITYWDRMETNIQTWRYFLERNLDIVFSHTTDQLSAVNVKGEMAHFFHPGSESETVLLVERFSRERTGTLIEYSAFYMNTDNWKYTVEFGG